MKNLGFMNVEEANSFIENAIFEDLILDDMQGVV